MYEKKPRSRVFAPLAETYRKLGMLDEAIKVLNTGIKQHPSYTLGYIVLANCYFDRQEFELAYNTIRPFVSQNLENITLQKLFAKTCINLGYLDEALQTFKFLLLINPKDSYVSDQIKFLEDDLMVEQFESAPEPETKNLESSFDEDEWVQVSFQNNEKIEYPEENESEGDLSKWVVTKVTNPLDDFKKEVSKENISISEHQLDDEFFHEDYDNESSDVISPDEEVHVEKLSQNDENTPIITHTLVDLYIKQGHYTQAIGILENIIDLHPNDKASQLKLDEVVLLMAKESVSKVEENDDHFLDKNQLELDVPEPETISASGQFVIRNKELKLEKLQKVFDAYLQKIHFISKEKLIV